MKHPLKAALILLLFSTTLLTAQNDALKNNATQSISAVEVLGQPTSIVKEFNLTRSAGHIGPIAVVPGPGQTFWYTEWSAAKIGEFFAQNNSIREFIVPQVGSRPAAPAVLTLDGQGRVWFSDENQSSIWMLNPSTYPSPLSFVQYHTIASNSTPFFVLVDTRGNVWFTELIGNNLGELNSSNNYQQTEYPLPISLSGPAELVLQPNTPYIWMTESYPKGDRIARFDTSNHSFQEYLSQGSLNGPVGIVLDPSHNIWVSEHAGSSIAEVITSNQTYRRFPTSLPASFASSSLRYSAPATVAIDGQSRLWFVEHFANRVGRLDPKSGTIDEFLIPSQGAYSFLNALDGAGNFWFTEYSADKLGMVPANATSAIAVRPHPLSVSTLVGGQTMTDLVNITNELSYRVHLILNITSTFAPYETPSRELSLNETSIDLVPGQTTTVKVTITPDRTLSTSQYSIGIAADYANASSIGILFFQVQSNPSLLDLISAYFPEFILGIALILGIIYLSLRTRLRRRVQPRLAVARSKIVSSSRILLGGLLILVFSTQKDAAVLGKCPGYIQPPTNGGLDWFDITLIAIGLAVVAVILFLGVRDLLRWRREKSGAIMLPPA